MIWIPMAPNTARRRKLIIFIEPPAFFLMYTTRFLDLYISYLKIIHTNRFFRIFPLPSVYTPTIDNSFSDTGDFMGLFKKDEPLEEYERFSARRQLMEDLTLTKNALDTAYANFETVVDPDLIDCYTYEIYSVQKRYKFLLEQVRQIDLQKIM